MSELPFRIKICGVTNAGDALAAVRAGADAIGLNFYPRSKRFVSRDQIQSILRDVPREIVKVGVFVNPKLAEVFAAFNSVRAVSSRMIDVVQLHGDEPADFLTELPKIPVMKAIRWDPASSPKTLDAYLEKCSRLECPPIALLIDSHVAGEFGGTGAAADWASIAKWKEQSQCSIPIVLAGGLTPENVAAAIAALRPDAVDTASGVEQSAGKKSESLMQAFVVAARNAFG
jgi:phosphoribosylanthranilate isomerase